MDDFIQISLNKIFKLNFGKKIYRYAGIINKNIINNKFTILIWFYDENNEKNFIKYYVKLNLYNNFFISSISLKIYLNRLKLFI